MGESNCNYNRKLNLNTDLLIAAQSIYQGIKIDFNREMQNQEFITIVSYQFTK